MLSLELILFLDLKPGAFLGVPTPYKTLFVKNMFNFVDQTPSENETTQSMAMI